MAEGRPVAVALADRLALFSATGAVPAGKQRRKTSMRIAADKLDAFTRALCLKAGSEAREAALVAEHLIQANLKGHDSHGVGMMPVYIASVREGRLTPNTGAEVVRDDGPFILVDGHGGYGQVIAFEAMELGIARARELGLALVGLRNSNHIGRVGHWGEQCAAAGMVSIHYVNSFGSRALVAPFGGSDARYTTNPYCTAIPASGDTPAMIVDFATSKIAQGKVRVAYNKGEQVGENTLIDPAGRPTQDPGVMFQEPRGALLSMGLHKGYGLALACDILAGALTGGGTFLPERLERKTIVNNMLTVILDPKAFGDAANFEREVAAFSEWVKASPPADGVDAVMVPGEPERKRAAERSADGIPVDDRTWEELLAAAESVGMSRTEVQAIVQSNF